MSPSKTESMLPTRISLAPAHGSCLLMLTLHTQGWEKASNTGSVTFTKRLTTQGWRAGTATAKQAVYF